MAHSAGEYHAVKHEVSSLDSFMAGTNFILPVICNSFLAFLLNEASSEANRSAGPLSMAVAENAKQVFVLIIVVWLQSEQEVVSIGWPRILGTLTTGSGSVWYIDKQLSEGVAITAYRNLHIGQGGG